MNEHSVIEDPRLVRTSKVARMLDCSPQRVLQLARLGVLTPVQLVPGGYWRFRIDEVERLIAGESDEAV